MGARDVTGLLRLGGGKSSILVKIEGELSKGCNLEDIRKAIEEILSECGLEVKSFQVKKSSFKKKKKSSKKKK